MRKPKPKHITPGLTLGIESDGSATFFDGAGHPSLRLKTSAEAQRTAEWLQRYADWLKRKKNKRNQ